MHNLSDVFNTTVPENAKLCVLGIYPEDFEQSVRQTKLLDFGLLQARRAISLYWKNMEAPTLGVWMKGLSESLGLERLTYISKGKPKDFGKLWRPYMELLENYRTTAS